VLVLSRKPEQSLRLGDEITITVLAIEGDRVKLGIAAPRSVSVLRQEVYAQVQQANGQAAAGRPTARSLAAALRSRTSREGQPTP
jgi:carbon storage regulator